MTTQRTTVQSLIRVLIAAAAVLAFGLVVNHFESGEGWSVFDFILVQVLVAGAVAVYELAVKRPGTLTAAVVAAGVAATGGAAVIVGNVDDAPGLILIGMGLIVTAVVIVVQSIRRPETPEMRPGA
jgi:peptidoglycan/LPS O-acetylase OafA/YrhL